MAKNGTREVIKYNGITWGRYPDANNWSDKAYFKANINQHPVYLHRYIWEEHHGPIPSGYVIHHMDGNPGNNAIENLEMVLSGLHTSRHAENATDEFKEWRKQHIDKIRSLAAAWHSSPEGREWHSLHGHLAWEGKEPITLVCQQCGKEFKTLANHGNTKFCSNNCKSAARRATRVDHEERICRVCGKSFRANKYFATAHCSKTCAANERRKRSTSTCLYCGNAFEHHAGKVRKYCSEKCWHAAGRGGRNNPPQYARTGL